MTIVQFPIQKEEKVNAEKWFAELVDNAISEEVLRSKQLHKNDEFL